MPWRYLPPPGLIMPVFLLGSSPPHKTYHQRLQCHLYQNSLYYILAAAIDELGAPCISTYVRELQYIILGETVSAAILILKY